MGGGLVFVGGMILVSAGLISFSLNNLAEAIRTIAKQIHVHAETMNEIKHQGIGIDNSLSKGERIARGIE